jgi:hypothetical protein
MNFKPRPSRHWRNTDPEDWEVLEREAKTVCQTYLEAPTVYVSGVTR